MQFPWTKRRYLDSLSDQYWTLNAKYNDLLSEQSQTLSLLDAASYVILARDARIFRLTNELAEGSLREAMLVEELERRPTPETPTAPTISRQSLYLTEEQEDIEYAYANDFIDKAQYEDMLKQLAFDNADITYDYERID